MDFMETLENFGPLCNYLCIRYRASLLKYHLPHICHLSNPSDRRDTGRTPLKGHTWFLITLDVTIHQNRALDLGHSVLNLKLLWLINSSKIMDLIEIENEVFCKTYRIKVYLYNIQFDAKIKLWSILKVPIMVRICDPKHI